MLKAAELGRAEDETPREYRERLGHDSGRPETWPKRAPEIGLQGTYLLPSCGCRIVGNGTLPYPLQIALCAEHALPASRVRSELLDEIGRNGDIAHLAELRLDLRRRGAIGQEVESEVEHRGGDIYVLTTPATWGVIDVVWQGVGDDGWSVCASEAPAGEADSLDDIRGMIHSDKLDWVRHRIRALLDCATWEDVERYAQERST